MDSVIKKLYPDHISAFAKAKLIPDTVPKIIEAKLLRMQRRKKK